VKVETERVNLPKLGSSVTVANYGEGATIAASDVALESVGLTMHKFATRTIASSEVLADSSPDLRAIVQADHTRSLAAELDRQLLAGSGASGQLLGVRNQSGVTTTTLGSGNGAVPTLGNVADALYRLEAANAKATAIFCSPRTWNVLRQLQDLQDRYQLAPDPTEAAQRQLFGVPVYTSSQISDTETAGSSGAVCSYILLVDMSRVVVGQRDAVNVLYDPYSLSASDQIVIRSTTRWGIALLDEEAVQIVAGVKAS
jgi:HK97 family phage major capsid protein